MRTGLLRAFFCAIVLIAAVSTAQAGNLVKALSVKGYGEYGNSVEALIDQAVPPEESEYRDPACVYWYTADAYFVIDLGAVYLVDGITLQTDNNDDYMLAASENGRDFAPLLTVSSEWGEVSFGMETISTLAHDPEYAPEAAFSPVRARYLKLWAIGGDEAYAASEVLVFGNKAEARSQIAKPVATPHSIAAPGDMEKVFDAMDSNHDGRLSIAEYSAIFKGKLDVNKNFAFFDKNGSGFIEKAEYLGLRESLR